jgi:glycosyltransferase involved in cell wall biosynthesis
MNGENEIMNNSTYEKLVVLIPAFNEEELIGKTIDDIPRKILGIKTVEVLVVDDGSSDKTVEIAMNAGADKVVSLGKNMGVASAFMTGVRNAISMKADLVVTLDADGQFPPKQVSEIIIPILNNQYDMVSGARFTKDIPKDYPKTKLIGNKLFSKMVSMVVGQKFQDTQTGFRAYNRSALLNISIISEYNFAQEVVIDLTFKKFRLGEIPVKVLFDKNRKSRIVRNIFSYSSKALSTIIRSIFYHRPLMAFGLFGAFLCAGGIFAKLLTISGTLPISDSLENGLIILGIVSFMMGLLANIVFKRQAFTEKDIRHYIEKFGNSDTEDRN